ncbi:hypothetical protein HZQ97_07860 [Elizabethkingia anophelis]|uniref:BT4734/BF3469 family protein n=1 Tax=Elizabethkingia TaxID=308865 RepID=UPI0021A5F1A0|nr:MULTISPECIES: BT4734/BF3469 family protein [unclassified Elizabethkingia]MCT3644059.1 hypothetical protein [Elizabethkingia anophelis]MCT3676942.1 hypothetical protein [Elizabethkingia anophelis]MCT3684377.1 hypothetical protein [Elizabethkingia anophelis]MDX8560023.1 BT4734/BF3469 family protein [Elizabethkingia sp. HX ZCH]MDX8578609.1 BT4734/BF3469 family protein [Elizabethkingia sp. HX YK]
MNDYRLNLWSNFSKHKTYQSLSEIYTSIRDGTYKNEIQRIRTFLKDGDVESSKKEKNELLAFTTTGIFHDKRRRKSENLIKYNGLVVLDIDKLKNHDEVDKVFSKATQIEETKMVFISPSGLGIKIVVETNNTNPNLHTTVYKKVVEYYQKELKVEFDTQTCDIARLCFVSYHENAYLNLESKILEIPQEETKVATLEKDDDTFNLSMEIAIGFTENFQKFTENNRNNFIALLAKNCCGYGLNKNLVLDYCIKKYVEDGFNEQEVSYIVSNSYKTNQFGKWKASLNKQLLIRKNKL